jgi:predicted RNase H-like HicB family nuclease
MAPVAFAITNDACGPSGTASWHNEIAYRCHICLIQEDDGTFSAVVLNLPGTGSCGDTEEESLRNVKEAIEGTIASHRAVGEKIPWTDSTSSDIPLGAKQKWILVNA